MKFFDAANQVQARVWYGMFRIRKKKAEKVIFHISGQVLHESLNFSCLEKTFSSLALSFICIKELEFTGMTNNLTHDRISHAIAKILHRSKTQEYRPFYSCGLSTLAFA